MDDKVRMAIVESISDDPDVAVTVFTDADGTVSIRSGTIEQQICAIGAAIQYISEDIDGATSRDVGEAATDFAMSTSPSDVAIDMGENDD